MGVKLNPFTGKFDMVGSGSSGGGDLVWDINTPFSVFYANNNVATLDRIVNVYLQGDTDILAGEMFIIDSGTYANCDKLNLIGNRNHIDVGFDIENTVVMAVDGAYFGHKPPHLREGVLLLTQGTIADTSAGELKWFVNFSSVIVSDSSFGGSEVPAIIIKESDASIYLSNYSNLNCPFGVPVISHENGHSSTLNILIGKLAQIGDGCIVSDNPCDGTLNYYIIDTTADPDNPTGYFGLFSLSYLTKATELGFDDSHSEFGDAVNVDEALRYLNDELSDIYVPEPIFSDWIMPNQEAMRKIYENNSVLGYSTSATFWTSTEVSTNDGETIKLSTGTYGFSSKQNGFSVIPIRYFEYVPADAGLEIGDEILGGKVAYMLASGSTYKGFISGAVFNDRWSAINTLTSSTFTEWNESHLNTDAIIKSLANYNSAAKSCVDYRNRGVYINGQENVQSDWDETIEHLDSFIMNKPTLLLQNTDEGMWYLPSVDELNKLLPNKATLGLSTKEVWTSTEFSATQAYFLNFTTEVMSQDVKSVKYDIVPVREFDYPTEMGLGLAVGDEHLGGVVGYVATVGDAEYEVGREKGLLVILDFVTKGLTQVWSNDTTTSVSTSSDYGTGEQNTLNILALPSTSGAAFQAWYYQGIKKIFIQPDYEIENPYAPDYIKNKPIELFIGANKEMSIDYDGTKGNIRTDLVDPSDLNIDCGTDKTIVLEETVYNDANVGGLSLRGGNTNPPITQWVDNLGNNTGIYGLGFAVNDEANGVIEIPHDYKEGTPLSFHLHWGANDAPSGTDYVKWQLTYSVTKGGTTFPPPPTPLEKETAYDTQYENMFCAFTDITGTNFKIGDQVNFNIKRITADGDAYTGVVIMETIGFHYECDTLGSRTLTSK